MATRLRLAMRTCCGRSRQRSIQPSRMAPLHQTKSCSAVEVSKGVTQKANPGLGSLRLLQARFQVRPQPYGLLNYSRAYVAADLPSHQEIGMPSLSPTMTQGNIAKWKKNEGDHVAAGDVLCEIETDKATLEMESMEEGYLAKILLVDGSKDIPVGKPIAIFVENKEDVAKFKSYEGSDDRANSSDIAREGLASQTLKEPEPQHKNDNVEGERKPEVPHQDIGMPSLSPTMTQGNIASWRKKEGEQVSAGDVLCEIETDKATLEMESMEEGYLAKIVLGDGSKDVPVGKTIAILVENEEDIPKFSNYKDSGSDPSKPSATLQGVTIPPKLEPPSQATASRPEEISSQGPLRADVPNLPEHPSSSSSTLDYTDLNIAQFKRDSAHRLLLSKQNIPHYYLSIDARVDKLEKLRTTLNSGIEGSSKSASEVEKEKLSLNDFIIKAAALALQKVPACNSSWTDDFTRQYKNVNISIAFQTDHGLRLPVIKDADKKGLSIIAQEVNIFEEKAMQNSLSQNEYEGGTFTVSGLGSLNIDQFSAIVNSPQSCILAVGKTKKRVLPISSKEGGYGAGTFVSVTLSCDHRVVDGAIGAQWLGAFKGYIEEPTTLLL